MGDRRESASSIRFKWLTSRDLTPDIVEQWADLSRSACTPNVYLSPDFLLPALDFLSFDGQPRLAAAWNADGTELLALGVFVTRERSLRLPFRALELARSIHSFQSGLLLKSDITDQALDSYLANLLAGGIMAVAMRDMQRTAPCLGRLIASAQRQGLEWITDHEYQRAALVNGDDVSWRQHVSKSILRQLRRNRRRLEELGEVAIRLVPSDKITDARIETFLALENNGWRRATSLLSDSSQAEFFRAALRRLRESGNVFFVELTLDDRVIASTVNFHAREHGFAFKIGWDPQYRKCTPGYLVEFELLRIGAAGGLPARYVESGAGEGSYLDALWPARITMVDGYLVSGCAARSVVRAINVVRRWLREARARHGLGYRAARPGSPASEEA